MSKPRLPTPPPGHFHSRPRRDPQPEVDAIREGLDDARFYVIVKLYRCGGFTAPRYWGEGKWVSYARETTFFATREAAEALCPAEARVREWVGRPKGGYRR